MRRTLLSFAILFFLFALASPLRFAYAAAPQTDPLAGARAAIESVVQSLTPPPLPSASQPNLSLRSALNDAATAQAPSAIVVAARTVTGATVAAAQSAGNALEQFPKRLNRGIPLRERIGFKVRAGMEVSMDGETVFGGSACARRWGGTGWRYHPGNGGATWSEYQLCRALPYTPLFSFNGRA
jgi:hypothetical protein